MAVVKAKLAPAITPAQALPLNSRPSRNMVKADSASVRIKVAL